DGTVWIPDDAGTPDAAPPPPDAAVADAKIFARPDARPPIFPDAGMIHDPAFLSADPGGGAACSCRLGGRVPRGVAALAAIALIVGLAVRFSRQALEKP